jgi:hypothetical protein
MVEGSLLAERAKVVLRPSREGGLSDPEPRDYADGLHLTG